MKTKNKVGFDSAFLMIAIRKDTILASVDRAKDRVDHLVSDLSKQGLTILVPTPALAEMLVHAGKAAGTYLDELRGSSRFKIADFDVKAAAEVALDIAASIKKGDKKGGAAGTWAKANFDRQIAAICKAGEAHTIYTDDDDVEKHGKRMGLMVKRLHDLPLPPPKPMSLFDVLPEEEQKLRERKDEKTEPAPVVVPESSERPATGEAARKGDEAEQPRAAQPKPAEQEKPPETPKAADKGSLGGSGS